MSMELWSGARGIGAVAHNTLREALRNKVFGSLLFFSVLVILFSRVLGEMSLHQEVRLARDATLAASTLFGMVIAVYSSVTLLHTEFERRTIYTILSKPIHRWQFLLGKYFGVMALCALVVGFMGGITALVLWMQNSAPTATLGAALFTLYLQLMIITALAHLLATIAAPLLAGFAAVALFIGGNLMSQLDLMEQLLSEKASALTPLIQALKVVLPNLEALNLSHEVTYGLAVPARYLGDATLYALSYAGVVLVLAVLLFSRRDLN